MRQMLQLLHMLPTLCCMRVALALKLRVYNGMAAIYWFLSRRFHQANASLLSPSNHTSPAGQDCVQMMSRQTSPRAMLVRRCRVTLYRWIVIVCLDEMITQTPGRTGIVGISQSLSDTVTYPIR
jgi:hypothetical protein